MMFQSVGRICRPLCSATLVLLMLSGCASGRDKDDWFGSLLNPICLFFCETNVIYAPGVEHLENSNAVDRQKRFDQ